MISVRLFLFIRGSHGEMLRYLVEENQITTRQLGALLGVDHSVAARILTGERSITVEHVEKLGARFKVEPQLFLELEAT